MNRLLDQQNHNLATRCISTPLDSFRKDHFLVWIFNCHDYGSNGEWIPFEKPSLKHFPTAPNLDVWMRNSLLSYTLLHSITNMDFIQQTQAVQSQRPNITTIYNSLLCFFNSTTGLVQFYLSLRVFPYLCILKGSYREHLFWNRPFMSFQSVANQLFN